jgi:hypothetical protein
LGKRKRRQTHWSTASFLLAIPYSLPSHHHIHQPLLRHDDFLGLFALYHFMAPCRTFFTASLASGALF